MKTRLLGIIVAVIVMAAVLATGCAQPAPTTPAPAPSPTVKPTTTSSAPPAAAKPLELTFWTYMNPSRMTDDPFKAGIQRLEQILPGRIKWNYQNGSIYGTGADTAKVMKSDMLDMEHVQDQYMANDAFLLTLPGVLGVTDRPEAETMAMYQLIKERADFQNDFTKNNMKFLAARCGNLMIVASKTPVKSINDLKGKSIRGVGDSALAATAVGATPVSIAWNEIYGSLERGIIWGVTGGHMSGMYDAKFYEQAKYFTDVGFGLFSAFYAVFNLNRWNKLPTDIQDAFMKAFEDFPVTSYKTGNELEKSVRENLLKANVTISRLPAQDRQNVMNSVAPVLSQNWINAANKQGYKGKEIFDRYVELVKKYEKEAPKIYVNTFE